MVTLRAPGRGWQAADLRRRIALGTGIVLLLCVAASSRLAIGDLWWGMTHHWTASSFGVTFELPVGWRQVERPDRKQRMDLRNAVDGALHLQSPDEISIWESPMAFDPVEEAQRWERLGTRLMVPGDRLEPTPKDMFLLAHARCSDVKRAADGRISFACFDKEGRWVAVFAGRDQGKKDLSRIMQSVLQASAGRP